jgi:hypothetical protein
LLAVVYGFLKRGKNPISELLPLKFDLFMDLDFKSYKSNFFFGENLPKGKLRKTLVIGLL